MADAVTVKEPGKRGETLELNLEWIRTGEISAGSYMAYFRFDADYPKGRLYNHSYSKLYRKLIESIRGKRYRFRHDFIPMGGIHPLDQWPLMRRINEKISVSIPEDIEPGYYDVSVKLVHSVKTPNYHIKDLLRDDDIYSGEVVARIRIE